MDAEEHRLLVKIVSLFASPNEGERASAASQATKLLQRNQMSWEEAVAGIPIDEPPESPPPELFILDELGMARSDLGVSEALRSQLAEELDEVKSKLGD